MRKFIDKIYNLERLFKSQNFKKEPKFSFFIITL